MPFVSLRPWPASDAERLTLLTDATAKFLSSLGLENSEDPPLMKFVFTLGEQLDDAIQSTLQQLLKQPPVPPPFAYAQSSHNAPFDKLHQLDEYSHAFYIVGAPESKLPEWTPSSPEKCPFLAPAMMPTRPPAAMFSAIASLKATINQLALSFSLPLEMSKRQTEFMRYRRAAVDRHVKLLCLSAMSPTASYESTLDYHGAVVDSTMAFVCGHAGIDFEQRLPPKVLKLSDSIHRGKHRAGCTGTQRRLKRIKFHQQQEPEAYHLRRTLGVPGVTEKHYFAHPPAAVPRSTASSKSTGECVSVFRRDRKSSRERPTGKGEPTLPKDRWKQLRIEEAQLLMQDSPGNAVTNDEGSVWATAPRVVSATTAQGKVFGVQAQRILQGRLRCRKWKCSTLPRAPGPNLHPVEAHEAPDTLFAPSVEALDAPDIHFAPSVESHEAPDTPFVPSVEALDAPDIHFAPSVEAHEAPDTSATSVVASRTPIAANLILARVCDEENLRQVMWRYHGAARDAPRILNVIAVCRDAEEKRRHLCGWYHATWSCRNPNSFTIPVYRCEKQERVVLPRVAPTLSTAAHPGGSSSEIPPGLDKAAANVLAGVKASSSEAVWKLFNETFLYGEEYWLPSAQQKKLLSFKEKAFMRQSHDSSWPLDIPDDLECLNYTAMKELAKGSPNEDAVKRAISLVDDYSAYCSLYKDGYKTTCCQPSRDFEHDVPHLSTQKFVEKVKRNEVKNFVHGFTVPKPKKKKQRTVLDGRNENALQRPPPEMTGPHKLPGLQEIEDATRRYSYCCEYDGRGWFHQFRLHPKISRHWVLRMGGERYAWMRMPMGWSHSVWIAHVCATELARVEVEGVHVLVYIDNVYFFSNDVSKINEARAVFEERCQRVSACFEVTTPTGQEMTVLGVQIDLKNKTVALTSAFIDKLDVLVAMFDHLWYNKNNDGNTYRPSSFAIWKVFGAITWATRILGIKLCRFPRWTAWLCRRAGQLAKDPSLWEKPCAIWDSAREELRSLIAQLRPDEEGVPRTRNVAQVPGPQTQVVWADASNTGFGIVLDGLGIDDVIARRWSPIMLRKTIAERELYALLQGVRAALKLGTSQHIHVMCDNSNVVCWVNRGRGKSFFSNSLLAELDSLLEQHGAFVTVEWIPSEKNLADEPSRRRE